MSQVNRSTTGTSSSSGGGLAVIAIGVVVVSACWQAAGAGGPPSGPPIWNPIPALLSPCTIDSDDHAECPSKDIADYLKSVENSADETEELDSWIELAVENQIKMEYPVDGAAELAAEQVLDRAVEKMTKRIETQVIQEVRVMAASPTTNMSKEEAEQIIRADEQRLNRISQQAHDSVHRDLFQDSSNEQAPSESPNDTNRHESAHDGRESHHSPSDSNALHQLAHIDRTGPVRGWRNALNEN
jgi:hypothetical protein